jgi:hypothetical protein
VGCLVITEFGHFFILEIQNFFLDQPSIRLSPTYDVNKKETNWAKNYLQ